MTRALLLVFLLLAAPFAAADHVYSHRVVVSGRLIGGDGLPLPGRVVDVSVVGERLVEPCGPPQRPVTDKWGDFWFCYHKHELRSAAVVTVTAGNASASRPLDVDLRRMAFYLRDANATGVEPEGWATTFHLEGRLWSRGAARLDGVNVTGLALDHASVNVTTMNGTRASAGEPEPQPTETRTDGYGDYWAVVRLFADQSPEDAFTIVRANGAQAATPLDLAFHRSTVDFRFPIEVASVGPPPGSSTPPVSLGLVTVAGLALLGMVALQRRRS